MMYNIIVDAGIAQLVEQRIRNAQVAGSSPVASSMNDRAVLWLRGAFYIMRLNGQEGIVLCSYALYRSTSFYIQISVILSAIADKTRKNGILSVITYKNRKK